MPKILHKAKKEKNDDFYTQLTDIEKELRHYKKYFKGKIIYCNCDDPKASNFFKFFFRKFRSLGLKKLITTCYKNQNPDIFSLYENEKATGIILTESACDDELPNINIFDLKGDGDFRSEVCIRYLKEADIVVTNPPFSLFREYVAQLVEYNKKFLIIGNKNAVTYKEIFQLIEKGKLWTGYTPWAGGRLFDIPKHYADELLKSSTNNGGYKIINGVVKKEVASVWFTNLDHKKRHDDLILYRQYSPARYPTYDNYDAIEVSETRKIPNDYPGVMGVPITFLDKYNPDQFEILGLSQKVGFGLESIKFYDDYEETRQNGTKTGSSGRKTNGNPVMKGKPEKGNFYVKGDDIVHSLYGRIFIRNRRPQK